MKKWIHLPHVRRSFVTCLLAFVYFNWYANMVGLRTEHVLLFAGAGFCYLWNDTTRRVLASFLIFLLFGILYDALRLYPNHMVNTVHIAEPYLFDKTWFGINTDQGRLTLNEYFAQHTNTTADVVAALFYLSWIPLPFAFAIWLWFNYRPLFVRFSYAYIMTNLLGFALYYLYPAAPPWYVELNGFDLQKNVVRSAAGLSNFDQLIGMPLFERIYQRNSNVFAAIPSLHSAYPLVTWMYAQQVRQKWPSIVFMILSAGIWCSAIYLRHHYIVDVLLGIMTALAGYYTFEALRARTALGKWIDRLSA